MTHGAWSNRQHLRLRSSHSQRMPLSSRLMQILSKVNRIQILKMSSSTEPVWSCLSSAAQPACDEGSAAAKEGTLDEAGGYGLKAGCRADTRMKTAKASRNTKEQMKVTKHKESRIEQRLASLAAGEQDLED